MLLSAGMLSWSSPDLVTNERDVIAGLDAVRILDGIYAAAHGETAWAAGLEVLADELGYSAATLEFHNTRHGHLLHIESARINPDNLAVYLRDFAHDNPRIKFLERAPHSILHDHMFMTDAEIDHSRFHVDFLEPLDLRYYLSVGSQVFDQQIRGFIALHRSGRVTGADEVGIAKMGHLKPHLLRVMRVFWNRIKLDADPEYFERQLRSYSLTMAESRLARAIVFGESLQDYAKRCALSMNTVYTHYRRIKDKLECQNQLALLLRLQSIAKGFRTDQMGH